MLRRAEPAPQLKPFVRKYVQLEVSTSKAVVTWPIPARSIPGLEFTFGDPYRIRHVHGSRFEITRPSMLIGAKSCQRIQLELEGQVETFTVLFEPTGLQQLFSIPGGVLVNEHYEADSVLGSCFSGLHTALREAKSFVRRVQIADAFFNRFIPTLGNRQGFEAVLSLMISRHGCVRVQALADHSGISLRQFERRFADQVGIGPKIYARILRFEAAMHTKSMSSVNWTSIAHELGYCDQAHMIHDFQSLSNESPSHLTHYFEILNAMCANTKFALERRSHSVVRPIS